MGSGDGGEQVGHLKAALLGSGVPGRDDQVDAVRAVADLLLDPGTTLRIWRLC